MTLSDRDHRSLQCSCGGCAISEAIKNFSYCDCVTLASKGNRRLGMSSSLLLPFETRVLDSEDRSIACLRHERGDMCVLKFSLRRDRR